MSDNIGVELKDDVLTNVAGGTEGNVNYKYPIGTKFINVDSKSSDVQVFFEIINSYEASGMIMYDYACYGVYGTYKTDESIYTNILELYFDQIIEYGLIEIYNG